MTGKRSIAFIGARGIGNYGGFETFVKEIAPLLAIRNIDVYCSCERDGKIEGEEYRGAKLKFFPIKPPKNYTARKVFEVVYDYYFLLTSPRYADHIILLGTLGSNSIFIPRLLGKKVYVNIDGLEWRRDKFSKLEKIILKLTCKLAMVFANGAIIDSHQLYDQIPDEMRGKTTYIAYGVYESDLVHSNADNRAKFQEFGIKEKEYWLVIARLEPENNIMMIVEAFKKAGTKHKLVIVGNFTSEEFRKNVQAGLGDCVIFLGHVYDQMLLSYLRQNCFAYVHGHSVGGTNPSLLEAMAADAIIVAHDNPFNREVLEGNGLFFGSSDELSSIMTEVEKDSKKYSEMANAAKLRALTNYSWEYITDAYDELTRE